MIFIRKKSAAAGAAAVSHVSSAAVATASGTGAGPTVGNFTVASTANWVYVSILFRDASGAARTWTVTLGGEAVAEVAATTVGQFENHVWLGKVKPTTTGSQQLSVSSSQNWSSMVAACTEVQDAHATTPDGTPEILSDQAAAALMTDSITASAGSLLLLALSVEGGDTDPFTPSNDTDERVDAVTGTGVPADTGAFVGTKSAGAGGAVTLGAGWSASQQWSSILHEIKSAA